MPANKLRAFMPCGSIKAPKVFHNVDKKAGIRGWRRNKKKID